MYKHFDIHRMILPTTHVAFESHFDLYMNLEPKIGGGLIVEEGLMSR